MQALWERMLRSAFKVWYGLHGSPSSYRSSGLRQESGVADLDMNARFPVGARRSILIFPRRRQRSFSVPGMPGE